MRDTVKYLKKSIVPLIIVIGLLVVQAMSDLSLPSYTSDIVNVGIQQQGIENAAPEAIRESSYEELALFMSHGDQQTFQSNYRLVDHASLTAEEYESYREEYPALESGALYLLNTNDESAIDTLSGILSKPMLIVYTLRSDSADIQAVKNQLTAQMSGLDASVDLV